MTGAVISEGAAGASSLLSSRPAKAAARWHGLSGRRLMVNFPHQLAAGIDLCSSYRLEHFYVPNSKKATKNLSFVYRGEVLVVAPLVLYCSGEMSVKQETRP